MRGHASLPHLRKHGLILLSLTLMKSHEPFPSPSLSPPPLIYVSSSQHPRSVEREHRGLTGPRLSQERWDVPGQTQVLHFSSGLFINLPATFWGLYPLDAPGPPPLFCFLFYLLTEALPRSPLMSSLQGSILEDSTESRFSSAVSEK